MYSISESKNLEVIFDNVEVFVRLFSSKGSVKLNPSRYAVLKLKKEEFDTHLENIIHKRSKKLDYNYHLGGNVFVSVQYPYHCIQIRKWRKGYDDKDIPTIDGISLKRLEWQKLFGIFADIKKANPLFKNAEPCYYSHENQESMYCWGECIEL